MKHIGRTFWSPSVTTQFTICPVPFHFDTYRGCRYGCLFCFARGDKYADKTIAEVCREYNKRENMRMLMSESK